MKPSITEDQIFSALGNLLTAVLPQLTGQIVEGQVNRVPSLLGDYIEMWPLSRPRLGTNYDTALDCKFTASMAAIGMTGQSTMTVTAVEIGEIEVGNLIFGPGVAANTTVVSGPSDGGAGDYVVSTSQTIASEIMSAGVMQTATSTEVVIQCDVHGPNSSDNAQVISQAIRSAFAVDQMDGTGVTPLFSDDPRQTPFETAAKQYEDRWTIDVHLQVTPIIETPIQFSDSTTITLVDVDVVYAVKLTTDLTDQANKVVVSTALTGV